VSAIESRIDELYQGPLTAFVASRTALARTLKGDEARRVKALVKPTVVPWAVNQVYWHARGLYDRLIQNGEKLRAAQVAALEGRTADVRAAAQAHRQAASTAAARAMEIATAAGVHPNLDELGRTFEALSLARDRPEHPGRLTDALAPAGFEALGGIAVKAPVPPPPIAAKPRVEPPRAPIARAEQKARERQLLEAARQMKKVEAEVEQAIEAESRARDRWEEAKRSLDTAKRTLKSLREAE
jgi:hypothetical protein